MSESQNPLSPGHRLRRNRRSETLRNLVREHEVSARNLIYPLFVREGHGVKEEIAAMPGQFRYSVDTLVCEVEEVAQLGVPAVLLFGLSEVKDALGSTSA